MTKAQQIIEKLKLEQHPEGGFFRETYRSVDEIDEGNLDSKYKGSRSYATCIYFLLTSDSFSAFHRIIQDEIWHFYDGSPLLLHIITNEGSYSSVIIGDDIANGETPQFVVPGGCWFAANVVNNDDYSLLGCTVSPGFDFRDFELPEQKELLLKFPQHQIIIKKLTKSDKG